MALQKDIELKNGAISQYHRIKSITKNIDLDRGVETNVTIESYVTSDTSKQSIDVSNIYISEVYSFKDAYVALKQKEKFFNALDC